MAGDVYINGRRALKPSQMVDDHEEVKLSGPGDPYVSRGGTKLEWALDQFGISPSEKVCLDVGASTGGFTDCLLQRGAVRVYAVDVGYGQLDWKLRQNERVVVLERVNARYLSEDLIGEKVSLVTIDVSFISVHKILGTLVPLLEPEASIVSLVKPQFEAGREQVGKGGVIRDPAVHEAVLQRWVCEAGKAGLAVLGLTYSPIRGAKGNIEFFAHLVHRPGRADVGTNSGQAIRRLVSKAHEEAETT